MGANEASRARGTPPPSRRRSTRATRARGRLDHLRARGARAPPPSYGERPRPPAALVRPRRAPRGRDPRERAGRGIRCRPRAARDDGAWSIIIATAPPRRRTSRARAMAPWAPVSVTPCAARVDCQKRSIDATLRCLVTTRSSTSRAIAHAARSQLPVCDAATTTPRPRRATHRHARDRRGVDRDVSRRLPAAAPASQRNSRADWPSAAYIARGLARRRLDARDAHRASTCARRMRRTLPASQPTQLPSSAERSPGQPPDQLRQDAQQRTGQRPSRSPRAGSPCPRSTRPRGPRRRRRSARGRRARAAGCARRRAPRPA